MEGVGVKPIARLLVLTLMLVPAQVLAQTRLVVIAGLSGEPRYAETFHQWAVQLVTAAEGRWNVPADHIVYLAPNPDQDRQHIDAGSDRDNVERVLRGLAQSAGPHERIFIVLIGHGSTRDGEARFNLPGPDLTASDFAELMDLFKTQEIVFVNAASASGGFIGQLSGPRRTVITATRSGSERNQTLFAKYFVAAFTGEGADVDKNDRVSALEAFAYARREVARAYESEGRLLTEHALLDDNGDGEGSAEPDPSVSDGAQARRAFLGGDAAVTAVGEGPLDPRLAALYEERRVLEERVAELRLRKDQLEPVEYERRLEELLVELALKTREIREIEGGGS